MPRMQGCSQIARCVLQRGKVGSNNNNNNNNKREAADAQRPN